ncbi:META domain-containing protein [bacterium]|nr:META domain-containing protein [bacterium]
MFKQSNILALLGAAVFIVLHAASPASAAPMTERNEGNWEISVEYPHFNSGSQVATLANAIGEAKTLVEFHDFLNEAMREIPELRSYGSPAMFYLEAKPVVTLDMPGLCSGYVERYAATGGANGMSSFSVVNYALDGNRPRALGLSDFFLPGTDPYGTCYQVAREELLAQDSPPSYVSDGSWTELSREQIDRFVLAPGGIMFLFDKGELGAGAEGTASVMCPWQSLDGINYGGLIAPLFKSSGGGMTPADDQRYDLGILQDKQWVLYEIQYMDDTKESAAQNADGSLVDSSWVQFNSDNSVSGRAGINSFSGKYTVTDNGGIKLSNLAMTRALNPDGIDAHFERFIPSVVSWHLENAVLYLDLPMDGGIMVFMMSGVDGAL